MLKQSKSLGNVLQNVNTTSQTLNSQKNISQKIITKAEKSLKILQKFIRAGKKHPNTISSQQRLFIRKNDISQLNSQKQQLQVTFSGIKDDSTQIQHLKAKKDKLIFTHPSLYSVLLYSLLFNHLHLSTLGDRFPKIQIQSSRVCKIIKKYISRHEHPIDTPICSIRNPGINAFFQIVENNPKQFQRAQRYLKKIINILDQRCTLEIYTSILQDLKGQASKKSRYFQLKSSLKMLNFNNEQRKLELFAGLLGIRLIVTIDKRQLYFGERNSWIRIHIKRLTQYQTFCLKKISCFENDQ